MREQTRHMASLRRLTSKQRPGGTTVQNGREGNSICKGPEKEGKSGNEKIAKLTKWTQDLALLLIPAFR